MIMLIFQERIAKEFLDKLVKWAKNIKISDPLEEGCRLGPVVSGGQVKNKEKTFPCHLEQKLDLTT